MMRIVNLDPVAGDGLQKIVGAGFRLQSGKNVGSEAVQAFEPNGSSLAQ
jgi:hypothetical protein